jgi:arylformamidase
MKICKEGIAVNPTKLIDISRVISEKTTVYDGDEAPVLRQLCSIGQDAPCNMQALDNWTTHLLTHVDVPRHFIPRGATLDKVALDRFVCPALVVDVAGNVVTEHDVPDRTLAGWAVLFRTRNSLLSDFAAFDPGHVHLDATAARRLVDASANLVGIDYLSIDRFGDETYPAHNILLTAGVLVLEGVTLLDVLPGSYRLSALPLRIDAADGSPVRAILTTGTDE